MAYYGRMKSNGKSFLRAMIEPSTWSSSNDSGRISTAYLFSRDVQWLIENFCKLPSSDLYGPISSEFRFEGQDWKLQLCLNYDTEYIELNLLRKGPPVVGDNKLVNVRFGLKRNDGSVETIDSLEYSMDLPCKDWTSAVISRTLLRTQLRKEIDSLKLGGLTIYCYVSVSGVSIPVWDSTLLDITNHTGDDKSPNETTNDGNVKIEDEEKQFTFSKAFATLSQNLKDLYLSRKGCDVDIKVKSKSFAAHRTILGARTPVLAAIFSENTEKPESRTICVEDCDPEAFEIFLLFVYSGATKNLSADNVMSVYYVANKYDLPDLKDECVQCMMSNLTIDNICNVLRLASRHDEKSLLNAAYEFFQKNAKEIVHTSEWDKFMVENSSEAKKLIIKFVITQ